MDYVAGLREAVANKSAVFVLGTGVSKALSDGASDADWVGLIRSGIQSADRLGGASSWRTMVESQLDYATANADTATLISVASQVQARLRGIGNQAYADWLRESVGQLEVQDDRLAHALQGLGCPLLTTNYDRLLERALGTSGVTWDDSEAMRDLLRERDRVGHLHGEWSKPETVILSDADYQRIIGDDPAQALQAAHYITKSFVFVGYGSGLTDPNFSRMLATHRKLFPQSRHDHYRLAKSTDVEKLEREHADDTIRVVAFGDSHPDLLPFIVGLAPDAEASAPHDAVAFAAQAIIDQLRDETVLGEEFSDADDRDLAQMTVPPVFLPLPHDQFVAYQRRDEDVRPRRFDSLEVAAAHRIVVVAGEEGAGVSTAIRWLVAHAALGGTRVAPLYVDARNCRATKRPLTSEVAREAVAQRLIDTRRTPLPPHVLALDNVKPATTRAYESLMEELLRTPARAVFVGVRQGDENALVDRLSGGALPVEVVYLGKPGRAEAVALAKLIAPDRDEKLADQVLDVIRREHLQRTPFNICMLLVLLGKSNTINMVNSSDTAVLDKYVQLLTGRSGSFLDPRWTLDPQNREAVLADLAKYMVRERKGALPRWTAIERIAAFFKSVDWPDDESATLDSFQRMRLLRLSDLGVQFQQSGYLHLFAAKAAIEDADFLAELLKDPLYYAPIIRHYAALVRQSESVVEMLLTALEEQWPSANPSGPAYDTVVQRHAPAITSRPDIAEPNPASEDPIQDDEAAYDLTDDADNVPFPLDDPRSWPLVQQLTWAVDLASRVVRDSDQLGNLALKDSLFRASLDRWGYLLDQMSLDESLGEVADQIVETTDLASKLDEEKLADARESLKIALPCFYVFAGISTTLSSRKLLLTLKRTRDDREEATSERDVYERVAAAFFAFDLNEPGWAEELPGLARQHARTWVVSEFVYPLLRMTYDWERLTVEDQRAVERFMRIYLGERFTFKDDRHKVDWVERRMREIMQSRLQKQPSRLGEGVKALDALEEASLTEDGFKEQ